MADELRTLDIIYDLIVEEKATFDDFKEFMFRISLHSITPDGMLSLLRVDRLKRKKGLDI